VNPCLRGVGWLVTCHSLHCWRCARGQGRVQALATRSAVLQRARNSPLPAMRVHVRRTRRACGVTATPLPPLQALERSAEALSPDAPTRVDGDEAGGPGRGRPGAEGRAGGGAWALDPAAPQVGGEGGEGGLGGRGSGRQEAVWGQAHTAAPNESGHQSVHQVVIGTYGPQIYLVNCLAAIWGPLASRPAAAARTGQVRRCCRPCARPRSTVTSALPVGSPYCPGPWLVELRCSRPCLSPQPPSCRPLPLPPSLQLRTSNQRSPPPPYLLRFPASGTRQATLRNPLQLPLRCSTGWRRRWPR
jgi:hypothetical protein